MEGLESFFTASEQLRLFVLSCLLGVPAGICFDAFRVLRMLVPHNRIAVAAEDIVFFFLYAVFVMSFTVSAARSEFRFYFCLGNILGFTVYHFTAGNLVTFVLKKIILKVKKVLGFVFRPAGKKFVLLCKKIHSFFVGTLQNVLRNKKNSEIDLIDGGDLLYNKKQKNRQKKERVEN
ncbi:MAG: spore cortex biosynthesis protein YabQ [Porcipelethomonas sp.]